MKTKPERSIVVAVVCMCLIVVFFVAFQEKHFQGTTSDALFVYRGLGLVGDSWLGRRITRIEVNSPFTRSIIRRRSPGWVLTSYRPDDTLQQIALIPNSRHDHEGFLIPDTSTITWARSYDVHGNVNGEVIDGRGRLISLYPQGWTRHTYREGRQIDLENIAE